MQGKRTTWGPRGKGRMLKVGQRVGLNPAHPALSLPQKQQSAKCIWMKTNGTKHPCCKRADGYWHCSDFAGNDYIPGIDAVHVRPRMTGLARANRRLNQRRLHPWRY